MADAEHELVARRRHLPALRAQLRRRQRRRGRRPCRRAGSPRVPPRPRHRRHLVQPVVRLPADGRRLRRRRLPGDPAVVRHARRGRGADRRGVDPRHPHDHRHRPQPRLGPAPMVHRGARRRSGIADARALLVPARAEWRRAATERLVLALRRRGVDADEEPRRHTRRLVPASLRTRAARPQLGPSRRPRGARGDPALLVRPWRGGDPHRLGGAGDQGPCAPRPRITAGRQRPPLCRPRRDPRGSTVRGERSPIPTIRHGR